MRLGFYNIQGGTGKTTIATNMAYHLSKNIKTVYVDCDIYGSTSAILFGFENNPNTLNAYLNGEIPLEELIQEFDTLHVITCDVTPDAFDTDADPEKIVELIKSLEKDYDIVIYDLPPNISEGNILFAGSDILSNIIIVAEDGMPGIANALKTKELLDELNISYIGTVVNKDRGIVPFEEIIDDVITTLPYDVKVEQQWMDNTPIVNIKKSKFGKELIDLANELAEAYLEEGIATERALDIAKDLRKSIIGGDSPSEDKSGDAGGLDFDDFDIDDFDVDEFNPRAIR
jgi:MinD-like ATPase involved in chromosome partitioning or flagellar assembly